MHSHSSTIDDAENWPFALTLGSFVAWQQLVAAADAVAMCAYVMVLHIVVLGAIEFVGLSIEVKQWNVATIALDLCMETLMREMWQNVECPAIGQMEEFVKWSPVKCPAIEWPGWLECQMDSWPFVPLDLT